MNSTCIEKWLPIPGRDGYEASNFGRIRSYRWTINKYHRQIAGEPKIKTAYKNSNGYLLVTIGRTKKERVHVLIAETFLGPKLDGFDVNHIDGRKDNNCVENLEYCTRSENLKHAFNLGLATSPFSGRSGSKHFLAKLNESDVLSIRKKFSEGVPYRLIAEQFGVSKHTVWDITKRRTWTHI